MDLGGVPDMRGERGFTLVELLVSTAMGIVVLVAIFTLVDVTTRGNARVISRVAADQIARPVMQRLVDELHSTCVAPNVLPIIASGNGYQTGDNTVIFLEQTGSPVSPTPDEHVVTLSGGTLTERVYPATGGSAPTWTFSGTPSSTRQLVTGVSAASVSGSTVPLFQYFAYAGAQLSPTPLPTPSGALSAADAARTVAVTISFSVAPSSNGARDQSASVSVSDSVVMRLSPASEAATEVNPPCA
jgi:type II secretory pathway pseudopilin PulG